MRNQLKEVGVLITISFFVLFVLLVANVCINYLDDNEYKNDSIVYGERN